MAAVRDDLTGRKFGRLTVLARAANRGIVVCWICRCDCGNNTTVRSASLKKGMTKSCGCLYAETVGKWNIKHSGEGSVEYRVWASMKNRCYNPHSEKYPMYGGRGIFVCQEWRDDFVRFYTDMGPRPSAKHSIERIDNDGPYSPHNCRWATMIEQQNNRRSNRMFTYQGKTLSVAAWAREIGVPKTRLYDRLELGWPIARVLTEPCRKYRVSQKGA